MKESLDRADKLKGPLIFEQRDEKENESSFQGSMVIEENKFSEDTFTENPQETKAKTKRFPIILAVLFIGLIVAELGVWVASLIDRFDWLSALWLGFISIIVMALLVTIKREFNQFFSFQSHTKTRSTGLNLLDSVAIGNAHSYCQDVIASLPETQREHGQEWLEALPEHLNDKEIVHRLDSEVLCKIDEQALTCLTQHASAASVMIAVSPFALVDMLIVLWRNLKMLNQISQMYGLHLGYWGRIKLLKMIFNNMLYAGASEILADAGSAALGNSVTSKLSTRLGQGIGAGILTARLGLKAVQACRPLPSIPENKMSITDVSKSLLKNLKTHMDE